MVREGFEASGDVAAALKAFPFWMNAERVLLEGGSGQPRKNSQTSKQRILPCRPQRLPSARFPDCELPKIFPED